MHQFSNFFTSFIEFYKRFLHLGNHSRMFHPECPINLIFRFYNIFFYFCSFEQHQKRRFFSSENILTQEVFFFNYEIICFYLFNFFFLIAVVKSFIFGSLMYDFNFISYFTTFLMSLLFILNSIDIFIIELVELKKK